MRVVFPADDLVAQFVVVVCAQRNDLSEGLHQVVERPDTDTTGVAHYYHRLLVSHYFEAAKWIRKASQKPEVKEWLDEQSEASEEFKGDLKAVLAPTAPGGLIQTLLWAGRNATFHYPEVGEPKDGLKDCLAALEDAPARMKRVANEYGWEPRYEFAEHVLTYRFLHVFEDDLETKMRDVQEVTLRHVRFADHCLGRYIDERGGRYDVSD